MIIKKKKIDQNSKSKYFQRILQGLGATAKEAKVILVPWEVGDTTLRKTNIGLKCKPLLHIGEKNKNNFSLSNAMV